MFIPPFVIFISYYEVNNLNDVISKETEKHVNFITMLIFLGITSRKMILFWIQGASDIKYMYAFHSMESNKFLPMNWKDNFQSCFVNYGKCECYGKTIQLSQSNRFRRKFPILVLSQQTSFAVMASMVGKEIMKKNTSRVQIYIYCSMYYIWWFR